MIVSESGAWIDKVLSALGKEELAPARQKFESFFMKVSRNQRPKAGRGLMPRSSLPRAFPQIFQPLLSARWAERDQLSTERRRWWANYRAWITVAAFALSLGTAMLSIWTAQQKDLHDRQAELSQAMQRIQDLILKRAELVRNDPNPNVVISIMGAQIESTVQRAHDLAIGLGKNATSSELLSVASLVGQQGNVVRERMLLELALSTARTPIDRIGALTQLGLSEFRSGSPDMRKQGTARFEEALKVAEVLAPDWRRHSIVQIHLFWADATAAVDCSEAKKLFATAVKQFPEQSSDTSYNVLRSGALLRSKYGLSLGCYPDAFQSSSPPAAPEKPDQAPSKISP
jgi:hypothetical protein